MRFHLRLAVIRNEIEMLENPDMRKIYEEINFPKENGGAADKKPLGSYIVVKDDTIPNQINYLDAAKAFVGNEEIVKIISSLKVGQGDMNFLKKMFKLLLCLLRIASKFAHHPIKSTFHWVST